MASGHNLILDLTTVLGASALGGYLANRLRQPVLLGYLASGLLVGPFGLKLVGELEQVKSLAEIGIVFLLFTYGVEFSLSQLKRFKDIVLKGSLLQISLTITLVAVLANGLGWVDGFTPGIMLGFIISLSSTSVVLKTLMERGETNTLHGQVMLAILIAQDLSLGLMLAVIPALQQPSDIGSALVVALLKALVFLAAALAAGRWIVPHLIKYIARTENSELFLITVIALCLGIALITAGLGLSVEMGAFVAGLMMAEIDYADQAVAKIIPLKDTFVCLFFASIGMLIEPEVLLENFGIIIGLVMLVMGGKAAIILPIVLKFGYSFKTAFIASFGLNQIGEFSFVLAVVGFELGFITRDQYLLLVGTTAITLVLTPMWLRWSPRIADHLVNLPFLKNYLRQFQGTKALSIPETICNHVVVAGYGRVGRVLVNILRNQGHQVLVIENSEAAIQRLRHEKIPYMFGDAHSELVLEKAHLEKAKALAIALPDPGSTRLLLKRALKFAPGLDIVARSHKNSEIDLLTQLGAREVVQPEFEAALEMGAHVLVALGETPGMIQSVINRIHQDRYLSVRPEQATYSKQQDITDVAQELHSEWVTLSQTSRLDWVTLAAADIRNVTGVTVLTIQQGNDIVHYPQGKMTLRSGDRLLVVGEPEELAAFRDWIESRSFLSEGSKHWVTLVENSSLVGMKPMDLQNQYNVIVQALRRQGKLYNPVDEAGVLQVGDCVLLSGEWDED
ncbi:MAG: sodium:calcium exchanger [Moorea sp. SIO3I7]|uniref:cation:proton antiporter domain-containing protein n=1 Tax=unclassified Moorena TaxID=2683338 RepID=UPI0013BF3836|nr:MULTISPECIES: cation:proton antiporter [unclassified Moorena]NEN94944.1 sodium:calcium exchanger [Moorena sp. SIO3I7]NEO06403.1 sodium:calcium exchanger [Moorena sp. SIO3I8]NEQ60291.1 sodium:calcium exchanger [Moorena sp. SIO4A1]